MKSLALVFAFAAAALAAVVSGVPNFHQVNENLYRGAQPSLQGLHDLARLGIKTVIDFREPGRRSAAEKRTVEKDGMQYINIPLARLHAPTDQQVAHVLALLDDAAPAPIFLHCRRGADRTGTIVACYRIAHDHWKNRDALSEARKNGMSRMERGMQHYVLHYQATPEATYSLPRCQ
ncbi:conserved exported hypothetical protein [Candidatus Sulfopaludibacter sp. SbA3]|nr:conserved exported hypothetical protein [Candidatus Sulfopaludibacter sp. SbA3]